MSRLAVPAIRIFEVLDQLGNAGGAQVGFEVSLVRRVFRRDAIDSAHRVAAPEIHGSLESLGDRARSLNEFAVHVYYIEIAVGVLGKLIAGVDSATARGCKVTRSHLGGRTEGTHTFELILVIAFLPKACPLHAPCLRLRQRVHAAR